MAAQAGSDETEVRVRLTRRGAGVLAAGVLGVAAFAVTGRSELLACGVVLIVAVLLALATLAVSRPRLSVRRVISQDVVAVGEPLARTLRFHNLSDRPSSPARWVEAVSPGLRAPAEADLPALDQRRLGEFFGPDSVVFRDTIPARRRGPGTVGPTVVLRRDPFGFAAAQYRVGPSTPVLVTPRISLLADPGAGGMGGEGQRAQLQAPATPSPDEVVARAYRPGDPLRRIHWRASAKQQTLMVRQEEERSTPRALIYLDVRRVAGTGDEESFERAVELAASAAVLLTGSGYELSTVLSGPDAGPEYFLGAPGSSPAGTGPAETAARSRFLAELAVVEPAADSADDRLGEVAVALGRAQAPIPAVAILVCAESADARGLAALAGGAEPPIAVLFDADPASAETAATLRAGGWRCVAAGPGEPPASVWRAIGAGSDTPGRSGRTGEGTDG